MDVRECAKYLNVSIHFLYKMTAQRQIPFLRFGRAIRFDIRKLEKWIEENSVEVQNWNERARELLNR